LGQWLPYFYYNYKRVLILANGSDLVIKLNFVPVTLKSYAVNNYEYHNNRTIIAPANVD